MNFRKFHRCNNMISEYKESTRHPASYFLNHMIRKQKIEIESLGETPRFKWGKMYEKWRKRLPSKRK